MHRSALHIALRALLFGAALLGVATTSQAQTSSVEVAALLTGRVIGAAKACGINSERIRRTSERVITVVAGNAATAEERDSAKRYFLGAQAAGADEVRFEKSKCHSVHVDFSEMEVKLGRAPAVPHDPLALKRGVPAIGALKPEAAGVAR
ncbi:MAG: hypothetical protein ABI630_04670 [Betaproteobacteria bacterium]